MTNPVNEPDFNVPIEEVVISPEQPLVVPAAARVSVSQPKVLPPKLYDFLKINALLILPALSALYVSLAQIWDFGPNEKVITTLTVLNVLVGGLVKKAKSNYNKSDARFDGSIDVDETDDTKMFSLNLDGHPDDLAGKKSVTFKVNKQ